MEIFAERLKGIREERNMSMTKLAEQIGTSQQNLSRWESGKTAPGADAIIILCKFFNVSADFLLGLSDNPN